MNEKTNMQKQASHGTSESGVQNICVYCGSGSGRNPAYAEAARTLGLALANQGIGLVYGGGNVGLMGVVASTARDNGGHVTGIIPSFLSEREGLIPDIDDLIIVNDMHERKMMMFERADAFVALPGGVGTLEELVEQMTWSQLGQHQKPVVLANIDGFWSPFLALLTHMREETFIREGLEVSFEVVEEAVDIIPAIQSAIAAASEGPAAVRVPVDRF